MMFKSLGIFCLLAFLTASNADTSEEEAVKFLEQYDADASKEFNAQVMADWNYQTDVNDENTKKLMEAQLQLAKFNKESWKIVSSYPWSTFKDPNLHRRFKKMSVLGVDILPDDKLNEFNGAISEMQGIYAKTKICSYDKPQECNLRLDPELTEIMARSRDYEELKHVWKEWHEKSGRPMRPLFTNYVNLGNEAAKMNKFDNLGELWRLPYESETFVADCARLWEQLKPFYEQLHAYVRRKLRLYYGSDKFSADGPIPAHLLGNMWAQTWNNIYDITVPFPDTTTVDVTDEMKNQGYDVLKMFHVSDDFFKSIGLIPLTNMFWEKSMLERPENREVVCHASAWDFFDRKDFRIKMCTEINMEDLITIHHEMGHIQYFMQYKDQPILYRDGANPGFHEAVGDTLALSVSTPKHLEKIGLLKNADNDYKADLNFLYLMALDKIAFLPFGYSIDLWRWEVFDGNVTEKDYNTKWWEIRKQVQGVVPPVSRSETDFDPGAKYHVAANVPYIRYFVSFVIQFQFYQSLCEEAGQYKPNDPSNPLHSCDIYQSKEAGKLLSNMLKLGSAVPWPDAMSVITKGKTNKMDASALIEYFKPLITFMESENKKYDQYIGWRD